MWRKIEWQEQSIDNLLPNFIYAFHFLPLSAIEGFDTRLLDHVESISITVLENYAARHGQIDFVGADFPCQPICPAGNGLGDKDERFSLFFDMTIILTWCQRENQGRPFQCLLENVQLGHLNNENMRSENNFLIAFLGDPFLLDAPSVGGPTHRLRRCWTNISAANMLQNLVPIDHPVPSLSLFLEPEHSPSLVLRADRPPFRVLNLLG